jgi:hypothetical protein
MSFFLKPVSGHPRCLLTWYALRNAKLSELLKFPVIGAARGPRRFCCAVVEPFRFGPLHGMHSHINIDHTAPDGRMLAAKVGRIRALCCRKPWRASTSPISQFEPVVHSYPSSCPSRPTNRNTSALPGTNRPHDGLVNEPLHARRLAPLCAANLGAQRARKPAIKMKAPMDHRSPWVSVRPNTYNPLQSS